MENRMENEKMKGLFLDPESGLTELIEEVDFAHEFSEVVDHIFYRNQKILDYSSSKLEFTNRDVIDIETGESIFDNDGKIIFKNGMVIDKPLPYIEW